MEQKGILNAFALKIIMTVLMVLDHIHLFLPPQPAWFHILGRLVAPVFCLLMTQSLAYTRNRGAYIQRMTIAGLIMLAVNSILTWYFQVPVTNGIFLALAVGAGMVLLLEHLFTVEFDTPRALGVLILAVLSLFVEGQLIVPVMAIIFYFLRNNRFLMCLVYAAAMIVLIRVMYGGFSVQHYMVFAVIPILLYNGKRGPGGAGAAKWFFYWFYPAHVWVLYFIGLLRG